MINLKKILAALLAAVMVMAAMIIPATAETTGDLTYTPPGGYTLGTEDDGTLYEYGGYDILVYNVSIDYSSVRDYTEAEWDSYYQSMYEETGYSVISGNASFANIGGYEYLEVSYVLQDGSKTWNALGYAYILNGRWYELFYRSSSFDSEGLQDFYNMVSTASFTPAPAETGVTTGPVGDDDTIKIYVNGSRVYPDSDPVIINDRTMVPIRAVAEAMGFSVGWDAPSQCVTMTQGNFDVQVMIGSTWITKYLNGQVSEYGQTDVVPQIINDRTYLPLRAVGEALGATVDWDGNTRSVYITDGSVG